MGMVAADQGNMQGMRQLNIVNEAASAGQQAGVFQPLHAGTNEFRARIILHWGRSP